MNTYKVAICVEDFNPSGGVNFITHYAIQLAQSIKYDVTIVARNITANTDLDVFSNGTIRVLSLEQITKSPIDFDLSIGTWWGTFDFAFCIDAQKYAWFVQSLESRFYEYDQIQALKAAAAFRIDVPAITVSPWIAEYLKFDGRNSKIYETTNGVDKSIFFSPKDVASPVDNAKLRIVIEGSTAWFKGLKNTIQGISNISFQADVFWFSISNDFPSELVDQIEANSFLNLKMFGSTTQGEFAEVLRNADVLIKSSKVEGLPGPHIEAFHCGCTGIFTQVTGIGQFASHLVNCIICGFDDPGSITKWLTILNSDRNLLSSLKQEAIETSKVWPSITESAAAFVTAVKDILESNSAVPWESKAERLAWVQSTKEIGSEVITVKPLNLTLEVSDLALEYLQLRAGNNNEN
jgi:glycosyltransferase involved in cell wall biosynthesis